MDRPGHRRLGAEAIDRLLVETGDWVSCDYCFSHVDEHVERLLNGHPEGVPGMRGHLRGCPACAEEAATVAVLAAEDAGLDAAGVLAQL